MKTLASRTALPRISSRIDKAARRCHRPLHLLQLPPILGLNVSPPPPPKPYDPADDDPDVQLRAKLYDHLALVNQAARSLFHSPRIRQSLEIHLSYVDAVESIPAFVGAIFELSRTLPGPLSLK